MNLNNTLLAVLLSVLGLFLAVTSLRLSSVIQGNSVCAQSNTLQNANRGILVVGIVLFMSSVGYLLCKRNCSENLSSSTSSDNMMYMGFNLMLGIVVIVLFSIVSSELNKCNASVSKSDSGMVMGGIIVGVAATLLSLGMIGKKLYENRDKASANLAQMKDKASANLAQMRDKASANLAQMKDKASANLAQMKSNSSPDRSSYVDPFGLDLNASRADNPNRVSYRDPFGYDDE